MLAAVSYSQCILMLLTAAVLVSGCNRSGLDLAPVEGVVTYNGAPVEKAGVLFQPESGPMAMGTTDAAGRFELRTANHYGALVGEHRVSISKSVTLAPQLPGERFPRYETKHLLPEKYASLQSSELSATVERGDNEFEFELE